MDSTPYKRGEAEEQQRAARESLHVPEPSPVAASFITNEWAQKQPVHVLTPQPSYTSSIVSRDSVITHYGLHRALNSLVVPNNDNPIATVKDRKNANYLENLNEMHTEIKSNLDKAVAEYTRVCELRDNNNDPKLEFLLNRQYLEANNALAKCSREYGTYIANLNELRALPKMSRREMKIRYTDVQTDIKTSYEDGSSVHRKLRKIRGEVNGLEVERQKLIDNTNPIRKMSEHVAFVEGRVSTLSEHVGYVEHLNTALKNDVQKWSTACNALQHRASQLEKANRELREDLEAHHNTGLVVKDQLVEAQRQLAVTQGQLEESRMERTAGQQKLLESQADNQQKVFNAQQEFQKIQAQLSFATATANQHKNEIKELRNHNEAQADCLSEAGEENDKMNAYIAELENGSGRLQATNQGLEEHVWYLRQAHLRLKTEFDDLIAQMNIRQQKRGRASTM